MAQKSTLRIRFVLNRSTGARATQQHELARANSRFAQIVVNEVGTSFAEGEYVRLRDLMKGEVSRAVDRELEHVVSMYKDFIVGKTRVGRGTLTTKTRSLEKTWADKPAPAESVSLKSVLPAWKDRGEKYLNYKQKIKGHKRWFEYSNYLAGQMNLENWKAMFGPLSITINHKSWSDRDSTGLTNR